MIEHKCAIELEHYNAVESAVGAVSFCFLFYLHPRLSTIPEKIIEN